LINVSINIIVAFVFYMLVPKQLNACTKNKKN
jgi:hypothetical protein